MNTIALHHRRCVNRETTVGVWATIDWNEWEAFSHRVRRGQGGFQFFSPKSILRGDSANHGGYVLGMVRVPHAMESTYMIYLSML